MTARSARDHRVSAGRKLAARLVDNCALLAGALIVLACAVVFYEVAARYLFGAPTTWSIDIASYLLLWATFTGSAYTLREGGHVAVDLLVRSLGPAHRRWLGLLIYCAIALFVALVVWQGAIACAQAYRFGEVTMSSLRFPLYIPLLALPVGGCVLLMQALLLLADCWRGIEPAQAAGDAA